MKTVFIFILHLSLSLSTFAADPQIVGELKPQFSVELSEADFRNLSKTLKAIRRFEGPDVEINSLFDSEDHQAVQMMADEVRDRLIDLGKGLADLRAIVYKSSLFNQYLKNDREERKTLMAGYREAATRSYVKMIFRLAKVDKTVETAVSQCQSEMCVLFLKNMIEELQVLARRLDQSFRKGQFSRKDVLFAFESELNRKLVSDLVNGLIDGEDPYMLLVATGLANLYEAGYKAQDLGETWHTILGFESADRKVGFKVESPSKRDLKGYETLLKFIVKANLERISLSNPSLPLSDQIDLENTRRMTYSCQAAHPSFMAIAYGQRWYDCKRTRGEGPLSISIVMRTVGVGVEVTSNGRAVRCDNGSDDGYGCDRGTLTITKRKYSPTKDIVKARRTWVGFGGSLGVFVPPPGSGVGVTGHAYAFGPRGSVASFRHGSADGIGHFGGASVGIQVMTIKEVSYEEATKE